MRKAIEEAFHEERRMNPFVDKPKSEDDDYDLKHYQDENLDYGLLETLTNEMLKENGGNLDREITDPEYEEISERYFKRLEQERSTETANAWKTPPNTQHATKMFGTGWTTATRENTRSADGTNTATDHDRTTPHPDTITTPVTHRGQWWTTQRYWWTSPTYWDGTLWGLKTAWQTWKHSTDRGTDSGKDGHSDHTKHFDWTGESKNGHQVHVVVYFEK